MNLVQLSAYFSNESVHAALLGVALVLCVDALQDAVAGGLASGRRPWGVVGLWCGLAALTKFTALAVAPLALLLPRG